MNFKKLPTVEDGMSIELHPRARRFFASLSKYAS
jgi:hypothetical protein